MPCSGPRTNPARRSASRCAAIPTASEFVWMTAARSGFNARMRSRYPSVSARLLNAPLAIIACRPGIVDSIQGGSAAAAIVAFSSEPTPPVSTAALPARPA